MENVRFSFLSVFLYFVLLLSDERHGKASAGSFLQLEHVALLNNLVCYLVCLRILLIVSVLGIGIYRSVILAALVEDIELNDGLMSVFVTLTSDKPVVCSFSLACNGDIVARFGLEIF